VFVALKRPGLKGWGEKDPEGVEGSWAGQKDAKDCRVVISTSSIAEQLLK
jgi:hypothetical protein